MRKAARRSKTKAKAKRQLRKSRQRKKPTSHGRRFTPEQRHHALVLVASGMKKTEVAKAVGTTDKSVREWEKQAEANGTMPKPPVVRMSRVEAAPVLDSAAGSSQAEQTATAAAVSHAPSETRSPYAPKDPGQGLSDIEVAAILELKKEHPSYGPAQIRAQLKRFKRWRVSNKAIAKVLKAHGYELVHRGSRPQGPEPIRFEAPRRNALWQLDYAEFRVGGDKLHVAVILDDFSRYVVGHALSDRPSAEAAIEVLRASIARHGKPEAVRTDRGGGFLSKDFEKALEAELIDHIVGRPYHPQGGGKVEALIGTLRRELWDVEHFADRHEATCRVAEFIEHYNERRAHMGIDGLTPADRYHGRADRVLAKLDAVSRKRNGALEQHAVNDAVFEETVATGAPMEVLRLVLTDGQMELRLCGARVCLGRVEV
ncbi:MAG: IS3 family transposase [Planctomycetota bacterium]|jgi:transposase InsO family protein